MSAEHSTEALVSEFERLSVHEGDASIDWPQISTGADRIAGQLTSDDIRTKLGEHTALVPTTSSLLRTLATEISKTPEDSTLHVAATQLARVAGNLCFDHDPNRHLFLETGLIPSILAILDIVSQRPEMPVLLLRALVGALRNSSMKYDPIQKALAQPEYIEIFLALIRPGALYTVGQYDDEDTLTRALIANWVIDIIDDILSTDKSVFPSHSINVLVDIVLSSGVMPDKGVAGLDGTSCGPRPTRRAASLADMDDLVDIDTSIVGSTATWIESLAIDLESVRLELAQPELVRVLLDFIELAEAPLSWRSDSVGQPVFPDEQGVGKASTAISSDAADPVAPETSTATNTESYSKLFSEIKASLIRALVEAANSDQVLDALFPSQKWLVDRLITWIAPGVRSDLVICATHVLASLARTDANCVVLARDWPLIEPLARVITADAAESGAILAARAVAQGAQTAPARRNATLTQTLFGGISLLRHLAITRENKAAIGRTGVIAATAPLLASAYDVVSALQNAVVGLFKHLVIQEAANAAAVADIAIDALVDLVARTDDVRLRSEASRTLVNMIKTLFRSPCPSASRLCSPAVVRVLCEMVRLSEKYPVLINEGIVGLTLVASGSQSTCATVVDVLLSGKDFSTDAAPTSGIPTSTSRGSISTLGAIQEEGETDPSPDVPAPDSRLARRRPSLAVTPAGDPPSASDMLVTWLGWCASNYLGWSELLLASGDASASPGEESAAEAGSGNPPTLSKVEAPASRPAPKRNPTRSTTYASPLPSHQQIRPEMIKNVCALVITLLETTKHTGATESTKALQAKFYGPLQGALEALPLARTQGTPLESLTTTLQVALSLITV